MQVSDSLKSRDLVDVAPGHFTDIELYWHAWELQSPRMEALSERAVHAARRTLSSKGPVKRSTMPKKYLAPGGDGIRTVSSTGIDQRMP